MSLTKCHKIQIDKVRHLHMTIKGRRKDYIIWSHDKAVKSTFGNWHKYLVDMATNRPSNFDQLTLKRIPSQIESTQQVNHNVLVINMPEPRRVQPVENAPKSIDCPMPMVEQGQELTDISIDAEILDDTNSLHAKQDSSVVNS